MKDKKQKLEQNRNRFFYKNDAQTHVGSERYFENIL